LRNFAHPCDLCDYFEKKIYAKAAKKRKGRDARFKPALRNFAHPCDLCDYFEKKITQRPLRNAKTAKFVSYLLCETLRTLAIFAIILKKNLRKGSKETQRPRSSFQTCFAKLCAPLRSLRLF
jgi:hypothetical protein